MILLSASLLSFAALESDSCNSLLNCMSLMKISSIWINNYVHRLPTPSRIDRLASQCHLIFIVSFKVNPGGWTARRYSSKWRRWLRRLRHWSSALDRKHILRWQLYNRLMHRYWWRHYPLWWCSEIEKRVPAELSPWHWFSCWSSREFMCKDLCNAVRVWQS